MVSKSWYLKENKSSVTVCALSMIIIGILMVFAGGLTTYIYFTEITPTNYDAYYQRYVGSSFPRIFGILILMAGLILFWGASIFLVYVNWQSNSEEAPQRSRYHYEEGPPGMPTVLGRAASYEHPVIVKESYIG